MNQNTYLIHYGVLGQKWGIRRYQNKDGTYNAAGKTRYGIGDGKKYIKLKNKSDKAASKADEYSRKAKIAEEHGLNKAAYRFKMKAENSKNKADKYSQKADSAKTKELTPEQKEARNQRIKTAGKVAAGVAIAAVGAYTVSKALNKQAARIQGEKFAEAMFESRKASGAKLAAGLTVEKVKEFDRKSGYDMHARKGAIDTVKSTKENAKTILKYLGEGKSMGDLKSISDYEGREASLGSLAIDAAKAQIKKRRQ